MIGVQVHFLKDENGNTLKNYGNTAARIWGEDLRNNLDSLIGNYSTEGILLLHIKATEDRPEYEFEGNFNPQLREKIKAFLQSL